MSKADKQEEQPTDAAEQAELHPQHQQCLWRTAMNRLARIAILMIACLFATSVQAQIREAESNGLKVSDNGSTIKFQTVVQGDSIYKVHERLGLPGDLKTDWQEI